MLDKQIHIYSVDTSDFYFDKEQRVHKLLSKCYCARSELKKRIEKPKANDKSVEFLRKYLSTVKKRIKFLKQQLYNQFNTNKGINRILSGESVQTKNRVSIFDSVLTRTLGLKHNDISKDIIIVQTYYFDILEEIILNGFTYNNEKYICFTASAGQIRTKKTVFIKQSVFDKHKYSLMCGLDIKKINAAGGVNINKYLAYLALCNSATDEWSDFNINKAIVVEDMETQVFGTFDYIDDATYEIERKDMGTTINHTDGCGMMLPSCSNKNFMIRMPWIKGLLVPFPFTDFIRENGLSGKVKDIYGFEHDVLKDGIEVILTKSQFKMWKYYSSWQDYKTKFTKYKCQAGTCNVEEDDIQDSKLNYQMLQTLNEMTDEEIEKLTSETNRKLKDMTNSKDNLFELLGVSASNVHKNPYQKALELYPALLNDYHSKEIIKQAKKSRVKDAKAGKLDVQGKYVFICPDLFAFSEFLFKGDHSPSGLLQNGEVSCRLFDDGNTLDCLRSPHLYREHALRTNLVNRDVNKWFVSDGIYTSVHDPISKLLMFDNDGDKSLVCDDPALVTVAERHMQGIVPLLYTMKTSKASIVEHDSVFKGLKAAYTGGNIGVISNEISKIWNSELPNLDVIKCLVLENNIVIDYAKTLYKVQRPNDKKRSMNICVKNKVPHFFIYAKDKKKKEVEQINTSTVNRIAKQIFNPSLNFRKIHDEPFDYKMLMKNHSAKVDIDIVETYIKLNRNKIWIKKTMKTHHEDQNVYNIIKEKLLLINGDEEYVIDVLIQHLYTNKDSMKTTLWSCFGETIIRNLERNISQSLICEQCGDRFIKTIQRQRLCLSCRNNLLRDKNRSRVSEYRIIKKNENSSLQ